MATMSIDYIPKPAVGTPEHDEYRRLRGCANKVPYSAYWVAANARTALSWVSERFSDLEVYPCDFCGHFHLGH